MFWDSLYEAEDRDGNLIYSINYNVCPPEWGRCYDKGTPMKDREHTQCYWFTVDAPVHVDDKASMPSDFSTEIVHAAHTLRAAKAGAIYRFGVSAKKLKGPRIPNPDFDSCSICDDADKTCVQHV